MALYDAELGFYPWHPVCSPEHHQDCFLSAEFLALLGVALKPRKTKVARLRIGRDSMATHVRDGGNVALWGETQGQAKVHGGAMDS